jgi:hypothetical protein
MIVRTTQPQEADPGDSGNADRPLSADYLVDLTSDLAVESVEPLSIETLIDAPEVERYWDDRLVSLDGSWYASATVGLGDGRSPHGLLAIEGASITEFIRLGPPKAGGLGDAWLPFVTDGRLQFAHIGDRVLVSRYDAKRRSLEPVSDGSPVLWTGQVLDGSQGLAVDDGFLFIVSLSEGDGSTGGVMHRLVLLDPDFALSATSRPFTVLGVAGELCGGWARLDDHLVISFAARERATLAALDLERALDLLD